MPASQPVSPMRVLRRRNFWPYFVGSLLSNCGTWFQNIAQAILVYRLTGSTLLVGVVNFAQFVGVFVLAPWAGGAADRFDRRALLVVTQVASVVVTGGLALLSVEGLASAPVVMALALLLGLATAFATPAMQAMVADLVVRDELAQAIALNSLTFNLARAIGPVAGAVVVARLGVSAAFGVNAVSFVALIVGLAMVRPVQHLRGPVERPRLRESIRLVREDARLAALLATVAAIGLSQDPVNTLTPGFSKQIFHRADTLTGYLVGAAGAGAVLAAVTVAGRGRDPVRRLPVSCAVMGIGIASFALSPGIGFAFVGLAIAGFGFLLTNTVATTALQLEISHEQRGRVMALWSLCFLGTRPLGSLVDGAIASVVSLRAAGVVMSLPVLVAAGAMSLHLRRSPRRPPGQSPLGPGA